MIQLSRLPDWRERLTAYLTGILDRKFDAATHHCGFFAADCVERITGVDLAADWRGLTLAEGLLALRRDGLQDHVALAARDLPEIPVSFAQPGDLAVIPSGEWEALGVVQGAMVYVLRPEGLGLVSLLSATRMFKVG